MKAILLSGGSGTRLYPVTKVINKHFLPIYNKPMIYYPLSLVMLLRIREVFVVINPEDEELFKSLLGDGSRLGMNIQYVHQKKPRGLAEGILLCEKLTQGSKIMYLLGDNVLYGHSLIDILKDAQNEVEKKGGSYIFGYFVNDPYRFGIVEFDTEGKVLSIEEKPRNPKSHFAVIGVYFFDEMVYSIAREVKPSERGELEITSVLEGYLKRGNLSVKLLGRGFAWFDAGTYDSFLEAGEFVATIEKRTGLMIGSIEEIAFRNGWISAEELLKIAEPLKKTEYGKYLIDLAEGKI